ncbi:MAG: hypothetical protein IJA81_03120 [Akkermansia sp.]|nr:hypothetical protein [Akkermansia sp.]
MKCLLVYILLSMLMPLAWAGELMQRSMEWVSDSPYEAYPVYCIQFAEDVDTETLKPQITGEGPLPVSKWENERELHIYFDPKTAPGTLYQLSFRPQDSYYLNGQPMVCTEFEFRAPACPLELAEEHSRIEGHPNGAVMVKCAKNVGIPHLAQLSMSFEFVNRRNGKCVQADTLHVRVKDLRPHTLAHIYEHATEEELAALTPDTIVPGYLLVVAQEPLEDKWYLRGTPLDNAFEWQDYTEFYIENELKAELAARYAEHNGQEILCLGVLFNAPIALEHAAEIFRTMEICCNNVKAQNTEGELSKKIVIGGQEITLVLHEHTDTHAMFPTSTADHMVIRLEGLQHLPLSVEVTLPAGTQAARGLTNPKAITCRADMNAPELALPEPYKQSTYTPIFVPPSANGTVELPTIGAERLRVRALRLDALRYWELRPVLESVNDDERNRNTEQLRRLLAESGEETVTELPKGSWRTQVCRLKADALAGTPGKPGVYVLHVCAESAAKPTAQNITSTREFFYCLHITDIHLATAGNIVLATRLSDGTPLDLAKVDVMSHMDKMYAQTTRTGRETLRTGICAVTLYPHEKAYTALVMSGDDYAVVRGEATPKTETPALNQNMILQAFTDRNLYRPGDTIHLFGTLRHKTPDGMVEPVAQDTEIEAVLTDAKGDKVTRLTLSLNEYGAFYADIDIPRDSRFILSEMTLQLSATQNAQYTLPLSCTTVQRNTFEVKAWEQPTPPRSTHAVLCVQARDFNGLPLVGATAHVEVNDAHLEGKTDSAGQAIFRLPWNTHDYGDDMYADVWVCNDREETVYAETMILHYHTAAVQLHAEADSLRCTDPRTGAPVATEQKVTARLLARQNEYKTLANGIVIVARPTVCLAEQTLVIPANAAQGIEFSAQDWAAAYSAQIQENEAVVELTTTDADGNAVQLNYSLQKDEPSIKKAADSAPTLKPRLLGVQQDYLILQLPQPANPDHLVATCRRPNGRLIVTEYEASTQQLRIFLQPQDYGREVLVACKVVSCSESKLYDNMQLYVTRVTLPLDTPQLQVQLDTPRQPVRPHGKVQLKGRVLWPDASPAAHAQVCLFAVDKGMQSLSRYHFNYTLLPFIQLSELSCLPECYVTTYRQMHNLPLLHVLQGHYHWYHYLKCVRQKEQLRTPHDHLSMHYTPVPPHLLWAQYITMAPAAPYENCIQEEACAPDYADDDIMEGIAVPIGTELDCDFGSGDLGDGLGWDEWGEEAEEEGTDITLNKTALYCRADFTPTPIWLPNVRTDDDGYFCVDATVADTLTTYTTYAVALSADGRASGRAEAEFTVNQPLMLSAGLPFFMSVGDSLRLPLTVTNNSAAPGTWQVTLHGADTPQQVTLQPAESKTLYFTITADAEGEKTLHWQAVGTAAGDALRGSFNVYLPAPALQEQYNTLLHAGSPAMLVAEPLSDTVKQGDKLTIQIEASANPLLQVKNLVDYALKYPYGCTEQRSSTLMPWLLCKELAPICPAMQKVSPEQVKNAVYATIDTLLARQCEDGGLSYWDDEEESCLWASAHAAMVLTIAQERGYQVPPAAMDALRSYLRCHADDTDTLTHFGRYSMAYALQDTQALQSIIKEAASATTNDLSWEYTTISVGALQVLQALQKNAPQAESVFCDWLQQVQKQQYLSTWDTGWSFVVLHHYLSLKEQTVGQATLELDNGKRIQIGKNAVTLQAESLRCVEGSAYIKVYAVSQQKPGSCTAVSDRGIEIQRRYEVRAAHGLWQPADSLHVGKEVRVTVTCKVNTESPQYLAIEDYLPACMKPIQSSLDEGDSSYFDYHEFTERSVRAFVNEDFDFEDSSICITLQYRARVVYSGTATAPPASAQLMYEPSIYGLSAPTPFKVSSKPTAP